MDDPHGFPYNRKRKADSDDQDPSSTDAVVDAMLVDQPSSGVSCSAPRQSWLRTGAIWDTGEQQLASPAKRPRHETAKMPPRAMPSRHLALARRFPVKMPPAKPPPIDRYGSDVEDLGIVCGTDPGPSTGSLLHLRDTPVVAKCVLRPPDAAQPMHVEANSPHIPPQLPLVNRHSLKELDLDVILRSPQLRHDLLFDSGLHFRPTGSRRKRELSEKYWNAVVQELESGCTCISFDVHGQPHLPVVCACHHPSPSDVPVSVFSPSLRVVTLRMPSRIRPLLSEFLEVLLLVLQPLSSISGMYVNPGSFKSQIQEHTAQASHIRSIFDPSLIEQELKHRVFDPSGLFRAIGSTLKAHCAPIRDQAVEGMVEAAEACKPGCQIGKGDPMKAIRLCMDILELMKLDIANHQLQTLRPYLKRTSGHWELKTFKSRKLSSSLTVTREWIWRSHSSMLSRTAVLLHPSYSDGLRYPQLKRNQQIYIAALKGLTDLVFNPPTRISPSSLPSPSSTPPTSPTAPLPGFPETCYLDNNRLVLLSADVADLTAMFMFLLLYRQLLCSVNPAVTPHQQAPKVDEAFLVKLKNEIRDIGSSRIGYCFLEQDSFKDGDEKWLRVKQDVVLQIAMRAKEGQNKAYLCSLFRPTLSSTVSAPSSPLSPAPPLSPSPSPSPASSPSPRLSPSCLCIGPSPDERTLSVAQKWADLNIQPNSYLTILLRNRLRDVVFNAVVALCYPGRDSSTGQLSSVDFFSMISSTSRSTVNIGTATGMEPLAGEIRTLAEKISRLALVHLNAYLPLYEHPKFLSLMA
ncbi:uncharacterized protein BT62DRAFT_1078806 [Guyanagaster necrorhizus]|uniref:Tcp11-domain-containing protein n=1 Tax=Guyanagaster necrorhizus TaxID=856835 RepID=A0A9P8AQP6_9AGAR|nr:uncharacterized protein BT62DRAFT_1078806 [Guyanagaster necrorhizus MCA 3950]KAG7443077.1 hypothetical protein BT62DRAFT_1078806 [Guyanagaster necrorhizus MCA 3950]